MHEDYPSGVGDVVTLYIKGPPLFAPGSAAAGSATEDANVARWKRDLISRAEALLRHPESTNDGSGFLASIMKRFNSDRLVDQPSALLERALSRT